MEYLAHIQAAFPALPITHVENNTEGLNNAIVIINGKRVFRFPKSDSAKQALLRETELLAYLRPSISAVQIPHVDFQDAEMVSYPLIQGSPLYRHELLMMNTNQQHKILAQLGTFLYQLHTAPLTDTLPRSDARTTRAEWLELYADIEKILFPLMFKTTQEVTRQHFAPLLKNDHFLDYTPCLIHADLAQYHLLIGTNGLQGVLDFGTAGIGDPALDFGVLINVYGESVVKQLAPFYPSLDSRLIDRARFYNGTLALQWALGGVRTQDFSWFTAHLDRAQDVLPIGSPF